MACAGVGFRSVCAGGARPYVNGVHPVDRGGVGTVILQVIATVILQVIAKYCK